jgi:sugar diacid utilization regulator
VLLSRQQSESIAQTEMSALVRSLIGPPESDPEIASPYAAHLGLDLSAPLQLIVLAPLGGKADYLARDFTHSLVFGQAAIDTGQDTLVLLANSDRIPPLLSALTAHVHKVLHRPATGVVSTAVASHEELRASYQRLRQCLRVIGLLQNPRGIFSEQELTLYTLLLAQGHGRADAIRFLQTSLGPLYGPDNPRGQRLAGTLLAYLDAGHNAAAAAKALRIHLNTVHQRLAAIDGLLPDWRAPSRMLNVHMALRLWKLDGGWGG